MRVLDILLETVHTTINAPELEGMKDLISRRIKQLPDDENTAKALKEIEDLLQHVGAGGRYGSIGKEVDSVQDRAVHDAKKVLARLVLSIIEETGASPEQRAEFFKLWKSDKLVNIGALLSYERVDFAGTFNGYESNPIVKEFVDEVMNVSELGMGRGEFGLNVLSKSISVSGKSSSEDEAGGSKKGDLQVSYKGKTYQVELKTEAGGAARFGDQEVRPAEGFEAAAVALNHFVKSNKIYKTIGFKLSGSGMNLNQAIAFFQALPPADQSKFLGHVRRCLTLIFGNIKGGRATHLSRLKRNVNEIMAAIQSGDNGAAAQAYSQASFNFYMSRKHDDGVLYTNLNNKTFVYYDDAAQLLAQGLRFHASTPYISATKDPVRSVYPQIGVTSTTFGGDAAQKGIKKLAKPKNPFSDPDFVNKITQWSTTLANRRGIRNQRIINQMNNLTAGMIQARLSADQIIPELERRIPALRPQVSAPVQQQPAPVQQQPAAV